MAAVHGRSNSRSDHNVFARLFPISPTHSSHPSVPAAPPEPRKFIKVRLVTWTIGIDMAETRPKGNLSELFSYIPPPAPDDSPTSIPTFQSEAHHPYHLVVVGGQECPSSSKIPKALGAGLGFKFMEKDKEKEGIKDKDNKSRLKPEKDSRKLGEEGLHEAASGWTLMLEDWLCNGGGSDPSHDIHSSESAPDTLLHESKSKGSRPSQQHKTPSGKGPYQLLVKERLMGIYLAIFVHRDVKRFIKGTSRGAVTAGLIGGRLGNKGGVGISVNMNGTSLLFLNCHLAAHEGKVHHRLANLAKIKAELVVEDFLAPDDPRNLAEDITDKFDFTFLFGDLNFRLDISRLHADWLIANQEYEKALAFDQLSNIMKNGQAFIGFKEAAINFAPTFKYDVLKTLKRSKSKKPANHLDEVAEPEDELMLGEAASVSSSFRSKGLTNGEDQSPSDDEVDPQAPTTPIVSQAAHKAKKKWMGLIGSNPSRSDIVHRGTPGSSSGDFSTLGVSTSAPVSPALKKRRSAADVSDKTLRPPVISSSTVSQKSSISSENELDDEARGVYDSSNKQRVPSWCDRILTKSTVIPDEPDLEDEHGTHRGKSRVGNFLAALRFHGRSSRDAIIPLPLKSPVIEAGGPRTSSPSPAREVSEHVAPFSRFSLAPNRSLDTETSKLEASKSSEALPSLDLGSPILSIPQPERPTLRRSISASSSRGPPPKLLDKSIRRASASAASSAHSASSPPSSPTTHSKWRFLPSLFSHNTQSPISQDTPTRPTTPPLPRKGDIICLSYATLSDRSMRNLEARSDHRPLIGSYAVYI